MLCGGMKAFVYGIYLLLFQWSFMHFKQVIYDATDAFISLTFKPSTMIMSYVVDYMFDLYLLNRDYWSHVCDRRPIEALRCRVQHDD